MDEVEQTLADQYSDIREGINDAAIELVSALDDIILEIEDTDSTPSPSNLAGLDDPAGMLQMYLEQLWKLHHQPKLQVVPKE